MQIIKQLFLSNMQVFPLPVKSYRLLFESVYKFMDDAPLTHPSEERAKGAKS